MLPTKMLSGSAGASASNQLATPIITPSMSTIDSTLPLEAPIARSTPISRLRSRTLRLIVALKLSPPTMTTRTDMSISRAREIARWSSKAWR